MSGNIAVGIDLGTTYSCVAISQNGKIRIVENDQGNRTTPSYVAFNDVERLIGDVAKSQMSINPTNTVFDAKRLIGRKFTDASVQTDLMYWPFKVINVEGRPKIEIVFKKEKKVFFPEEISSMVLTKMKEIAEAYLDSTVKNVVITVPAYFNNSQRLSTKNAGRIAGLNVLRIINEPTAAALAYGMDNKSSEKRHVLVYDLGGGTFDVSVILIDNGVFDVKATGGDAHLGGKDFDNRLVDYFVEELQKKHKKNLKNDKRVIQKLLSSCERAKRSLSSATQAFVDIEVYGKDFLSSISRARFEGMNEDLFNSTLETVGDAIRDAGITKDMIHEVILVGGSTRIPRIQEMLKEYFEDIKINKSINPDEAVAYGAAVQASILEGSPVEEMMDIRLLDVTPLSLGIDILGDRMSVIVKRNTPIPCSMHHNYVTAFDDQTTCRISVYEGERIIASENALLASFTIEGIPPAPAGHSGHMVTFEIDHNGILQVTALVRATGEKRSIIVTNQSWVNPEDLQRMLQEANNFRDADAIQSQRLTAKAALEVYCVNTKRKVEKMKSNPNADEDAINLVLKKIAESMAWLETKSNAVTEDYQNRQTKLEIQCMKLLDLMD